MSNKSFKSGDKVVCPPHGIGVVNNILTKAIAGTEQKLFDITIISSGMKLLIPYIHAEQGGLRKVADKKSVEKVYEILKDRKFKIDTQTWNRRYREYSQKLKTGSVFEIAEVLRDLRVLGVDKELSFGEKQMLESAQNLLVAEIAIAKARTHDKVIQEFSEIFA